jgi:hypothetical protein
MQKEIAMLKFRNVRYIVGVLSLLVACSYDPAQASEQASGVISRLFLARANNFAFRVYLRNGGADALSSCNYSFAFMNTDDDNYQAKAATLLSAQAQRQTVNVVFDRDAAGWCRIVEFFTSTN